jgi:hypothetical protein
MSRQFHLRTINLYLNILATSHHYGLEMIVPLPKPLAMESVKPPPIHVHQCPKLFQNLFHARVIFFVS